ncbi:restriction endonuclease [Carbonactinospora thermoautotrophica]|uniref:restriction endonuclease n=1 Tax=Carbonactinospora thermoautotrophica TaxID=1469144 RepID=UPI00099EB658|nr:restriction endonuclease [Carbonactinospora thermoautotrophica]
MPRKGRWQELRRHLAWGQGQDLHDIASLDWPSVRSDIEANLYSELEPLPVEVENLGSLVQSKPSGPVTTKLKWDAISAEDFERLLFNIIADASDYTNPKWLMHTNAPDRGRDISAERVTSDTLSGTKNQRVIIQAKHWQNKSVGVQEVSEAVAQVALWEPPRVHVLVIATSGRFTSDAVAWIEKHNDAGRQPHIEMWPDSHLELLLAQRPHLIAEFNLR